MRISPARWREGESVPRRTFVHPGHVSWSGESIVVLVFFFSWALWTAALYSSNYSSENLSLYGPVRVATTNEQPKPNSKTQIHITGASTRLLCSSTAFASGLVFASMDDGELMIVISIFVFIFVATAFYCKYVLVP